MIKFNLVRPKYFSTESGVGFFVGEKLNSIRILLGAWSMYGEDENCMRGFGKESMEDPVVDRTIILKWILKKWDWT